MPLTPVGQLVPNTAGSATPSGTSTAANDKKQPVYVKPTVKTSEHLSDHGIGIHSFTEKLNHFYFAPPSSQVWTVQIKLHALQNEKNDVKQHSLTQLYANIRSAIGNFNTNIETQWGVDISNLAHDKNNSKKGDEKFIEALEQELQFFLCNSVTLPSQSLSAVSAANGQAIMPYTGFLNVSPNKIVQNRSVGSQLSLSFMVSNWSVLDILIYPWVAAVTMQGLIRDDSLPELTADVVLRQYAVSTPYGKSVALSPDGNDTMTLLKTYYVYEAYPTQVQLPSYGYKQEDGGYKLNNSVTFNFTDMKIVYNV